MKGGDLQLPERSTRMKSWGRCGLLGLSLLGGACAPQTPASRADATLTDAAPQDAASSDAAPQDAASSDAALPDAASVDAALPDSARPDAGSPDAALPDAAPPPPPRACLGTYGRAEDLGILDDERIDEASGLVASSFDPRVVWTHNDSGDVARLFAVDTTGRRLGLLYLPEAENIDFEDLARAACPDASGPCLWVADTGTNEGDRAEFALYATPEPRVAFGVPFEDFTADRMWRFRFRYPDGVVDSEALLVDRDGGAFRTIEKVDAPRARVFRSEGPLVPDALMTLVEESTLDAPGFAIPQGRMVTGAALHPLEDRVLLRVYTGSYEYRLAPGQGLGDLARVAPTMVSAGPLSEPQGEAIAYDGSGLNVLTVSEDAQRTGRVPLHVYRCLP